MAQLTIFGSARSRSIRVLWMAAELNLDFEHIQCAAGDAALGDTRFLAINPNGRIPAIDDNGFTLWESLAINLYLAKKYGSKNSAKPLYPTTPEGEALVWQWSFWAACELEALLETLRNHRTILEDKRRDPATALAAEQALNRPLGVLNSFLSGHSYLAGDQFSVADLNVACVLSPSRAALLNMAPYPAVNNWLERCYQREAAVRVRRQDYELQR
jgi:glutathione S-transferase